MDFQQSTKVVYDRIESIEPKHVSKIIGYLLLQDNGEREMIRLAFGPDSSIHSLILKAKLDLGLSPKPAVSIPVPVPLTSVNMSPSSDLPTQFTPFSPVSSRPFSSPPIVRPPAPYWDPSVVVDQPPMLNMDFIPPNYPEPVFDDYHLRDQGQFFSLEDQLESMNLNGNDFAGNYYFPEGGLNARPNRRFPGMPDYPVKTCHYFNKGFCKHGSNCRYIHGQPMQDSFSQSFGQSLNDYANDDHVFLPGSLEKLEMELTELLKSRRGYPVSIASLPLLYQEKYGRTLQAEGYLTESQRHGKAGYSLTKLLARLKNSIRLIDRPHGQHAVVLAEDAARYMDYRSERNDPGGIVAGSRQIYLTFPAESTFTEEDVSNYFQSFGPVEDVRIPCQVKRMFGFVTFVYPETVKIILTKGNPHFVRGARVLVKPYREKSRLADRKYEEFPSHYLDMDPDLQHMPRVYDHSRLFRKQFMEERGHAIEFEARRLSELQLSPKPLTHQPLFGYSVDNFKGLEAHRDHNEFASTDRFSYLFDVLNNGSTSDEKAKHSNNNNYNDTESNLCLNLPESPFAPPIGTSISTVT